MQFMKKLRSISIRRNLVASVILIAAAIVLFLAFGGKEAILSFFPKTSEELTPETIEGAYVELDIPVLWDQYGTLEEYKNDVPTGKTIAGYYWASAFLGEDTVADIALHVYQDRLSEADAFLDGCYDYFSETTETVPDPIHIEGTVMPMEEEEAAFFTEYTEGNVDLLIPCYINVNRAGKTPVLFARILLAVDLLLLIWGLSLIIRAASGSYQKKLRQQLAAMGDEEAMLERLDRFYENTTPVENVWMNEEFVVFLTGPKPILLRPWDLAWAYQSTVQHRRNGVPTGKTYSCILRTMDGQKYELSMKEAKVQQLLSTMQEKLPGVVLGYSKDIEDLYKQNRDSFRARWEEVHPGCMS